MKRLLVFILALALLWTALPAAAGTYTHLDLFPVSEPVSIRYAAWFQGTLYMRLADGLYTWREGQDAAVRIADGTDAKDFTCQWLLPDGEHLYAYDGARALLAKVTLVEGVPVPGAPVALDFHGLMDSESQDQDRRLIPAQAVILDGHLYLLFQDVPRGSREQLLVSFDAVNGVQTVHAARHIQAITPYRDGQLLVMQAENDAWGSEPDIAVLDPATGTLTRLGTLPVDFQHDLAALAYDAEADAIYYLDINRIWRRDAQGVDAACGTLPVSSLFSVPVHHRLMLLEPSLSAAVTWDNVYIRSTDPGLLPPEKVGVYGVHDDQLHEAAADRMPEVQVRNLAHAYFPSAQTLSQALLLGDEGIDVFLLYTHRFDVRNLINKGYCADLSGNSTLMEFVDGLYPFIKEACVQDGRLYYVPVGIDISIGSLYPGHMEQAGIEAPDSFTGLCAQVDAWDSQHAGDHPDLLPLQDSNYREALLVHALKMYHSYVLFHGEELRYDTPLFRGLMQAVEGADTSMFDIPFSPDDAAYDDKLEQRFAVPHLYALNSQGDSLQAIFESLSFAETSPEHRRVPWAMPLVADEPPIIRTMLVLAAVNPRSANIASAVAYVQHLVESLSQDTRTMMNPNLDTRPERADYQRQVDSIRAFIESQKAKLALASGAERTQVEDTIRNQQLLLERIGAERYALTEDELAQYRKWMQRAVLDMMLPEQLPAIEFETVLARLVDRQMTVDQFITEMDAKLRLRRLENR